MERAIALGEDDPFAFVLAEALGKHLHEVDAMPYGDYVRWVAFYKWRAAQEDLARRTAEGRARRR